MDHSSFGYFIVVRFLFLKVKKTNSNLQNGLRSVVNTQTRSVPIGYYYFTFIIPLILFLHFMHIHKRKHEELESDYLTNISVIFSGNPTSSFYLLLLLLCFLGCFILEFLHQVTFFFPGASTLRSPSVFNWPGSNVRHKMMCSVSELNVSRCYI